MTQIDGDGSITPQMRATYRKEFQEGVDLFQKSLEEYKKADFDQKKATFKDVMDKALQIMNETIRAGLGDELAKKTDKLETDYNALLGQENKQNYEKLQRDLSDIKRLM